MAMPSSVRCYTFLCLILSLTVTACAPRDEAADGAATEAPDHGAIEPASPSSYMYVWAGDMDRGEEDTDFLAVIDADPESPSYGSVLGTAPVGSAGNDPHHAEPVAPSEGLLLANGFESNRTFLFDLSSPENPAFVREMDKVPGYEYLHSFYRVPSGEVLATIQKGDGTRPGDTGGLAKFDAHGNLIQVTSAEAPGYEGKLIRPYAVEAMPEIDRVVTTSFSMTLEPSENLVQVWRLSDLALLATLPLPEVPPAQEPPCYIEQIAMGEEGCTPPQIPGHDRPFEIRTLPDGSAVLNTIPCGFYRVHSLETDPQIELLMNWGETAGCAVPTMVGRFQVMPNMFGNDIVTLDVSDPTNPVEVARLTFEDQFGPHWAQVDPGTHRVAVTGIGPDAGQVRIFWVDPETGELTADERLGPKGVDMMRPAWPHGATGGAMPHAVLFGQ